MTKEELKKDRYYHNRYGITLAEFQEMSKDGCWACGAFGKTKALHVDHDHKLSHLKIKSLKLMDGLTWWACVNVRGISIEFFGKSKSEAIQGIRQKLKRLSVRGVLCWADNAALRKLRDRADVAEKLAAYLRRYESGETSEWISSLI